MIFKDRQQAGEKLAAALTKYRAKKPLILGIPRGGIIVAYEIAKALNAPLDIIVARKLASPSQPEYAIGAIAPGGIKILNSEAVQYFGLDKHDLDEIITQEKQELERRMQIYRAGKKALNVKNKTVIIVDDGLATGLTAKAAVRSVKALGAREVILAVPVAAADTAADICQEVDELICLSTPSYFGAVGQFYKNFPQTTDEEVSDILIYGFNP
jgi:predicted phosphoribosyltransferase